MQTLVTGLQPLTPNLKTYRLLEALLILTPRKTRCTAAAVNRERQSQNGHWYCLCVLELFA